MTSSKLTLGFVPLLDCAPLVAAVEQGFAEAEGLTLTLVRETSWANIRDRIMVGHFDAAHMLGPMAVASSLGLGHPPVPMVAAMSLGLGGNAITVSQSLWREMLKHGAALNAEPQLQGQALKQVIAARAARGDAPLHFGMVHLFSCHNYELRYWLAACGIDPDHDVQLSVIPPPLMVDALRETEVDGFCVGEPWNSLAVETGFGVIVTTTQAIWRLSPEKVLGCRADWAEQHGDELQALIRCLYRAGEWIQDANHHAQLAELLAQPRYIGTSKEVLRRSLSGKLRLQVESAPITVPDFYVPSRHAANFPWASHALWFYSQMVRWQQTAFTEAALAIARATYRPDLYAQAVASLGVKAPMTDFKTERTTSHTFNLTTDTDALHIADEGFFDGKVFEPTALREYIDSFNQGSDNT